jgi:hypothetical protein
MPCVCALHTTGKPKAAAKKDDKKDGKVRGARP